MNAKVRNELLPKDGNMKPQTEAEAIEWVKENTPIDFGIVKIEPFKGDFYYEYVERIKKQYIKP